MGVFSLFLNIFNTDEPSIKFKSSDFLLYQYFFYDPDYSQVFLKPTVTFANRYVTSQI